MVRAFEEAEASPLAERLIVALEAGAAAGGERAPCIPRGSAYSAATPGRSPNCEPLVRCAGYRPACALGTL